MTDIDSHNIMCVEVDKPSKYYRLVMIQSIPALVTGV